METFETAIILKPDLNATVTKAKIKKLTSLLQSWSKRKKVKVEDMGEKKLAYTIKDYTEGYYLLFTYQCDSIHTHISELEKILRESNDVLKFITIKVDSFDVKLDDLPEEETKIEQDASSREIDAFDLIFGEVS